MSTNKRPLATADASSRRHRPLVRVARALCDPSQLPTPAFKCILGFLAPPRTVGGRLSGERSVPGLLDDVVPAAPGIARELTEGLNAVSALWATALAEIAADYEESSLRFEFRTCSPREVELLHATVAELGPGLRCLEIRVGTRWSYVGLHGDLQAPFDAWEALDVKWGEVFSRCPRLQRLDLSVMPLRSSQLVQILRMASMHCPKLQALSLPEKERPEDVVGVDVLPVMTELYSALAKWHGGCGLGAGIRQLTVPHRVAKPAPGIPILVYDDEFLRAIAQFCPNLEYLDGWRQTFENYDTIKCDEKWTCSLSAWDAFCRSCSQLREFNWIVVPFIDEFFNAFGESPKWGLTEMIVAATDPGRDTGVLVRDRAWRFSSSGLQNMLKACPSLESLSLFFAAHVADQMRQQVVDDNLLEALPQVCSKLKTLVIQDRDVEFVCNPMTKVTDRGVMALARLPALRYLDLMQNRCSGVGVCELMRLAPRTLPARHVHLVDGFEEDYAYGVEDAFDTSDVFYTFVTDTLQQMRKHWKDLQGRKFSVVLRNGPRYRVPEDQRDALWFEWGELLRDLGVLLPAVKFVVRECDNNFHILTDYPGDGELGLVSELEMHSL